MSPAPTPAQLDRFRLAIAARLALQVEVIPTADLAGTLNRRLRARGMTADGYLDWLESPAADGDVPALARELTVGETSFFRNIEQFHALSETVVPELLRQAGATRPIRVLSAGCASGEEPYSIAMTLRGMAPGGPVAWSVAAFDVNPAALEKARKGVYTAWALRDTPLELRRRWFRMDGAKGTLAAQVREDVAFEQRNLAGDDDAPWPPGVYDIVFCRNVLMYFTREAARAAVARLERSLAPDGVLFLGHAESLRGLSEGFALREAHGTFYYRREAREAREARESREAPRLARARLPSSGPAPSAVPADAARTRTAWPSTPHVESLRPPGESKTGSPPEPGPLGRAVALFGQERFDDALAAVRTLDDATAGSADAMLLHALALAHAGRFAPAQKACTQLLAIDESHAGAFYVLALCRDGLGDAAGAARDDRCAIELDPRFPMPRLHLGLLSRRAGDRAAGRRHLDEAIALLEHEDAARLALFGGGFGREALMAICRAERRLCESPAA